MSTLGKTIKLHRIKAEIKQKELAKRLDISSSYLSLIENDSRKPSMSLVEKIAKELDMPVSYMLLLAYEKPSNLPKDQERLWDLMREILGHLQELNTQSKESHGNEQL